ncbi:MAG: SPOR domain-containing protein [Bacteroidia bacterium]
MKFNLKLLVILITGFVMLIVYANAQPATGSESQMDALVNKHISINQKKQAMPGYRVQIYFGAKREAATEIKNGFNQSFPDIPAYLLYQQPNFKVRVGDCKTRLEAVKILELIKNTYEVAFIVKDDVKLPEIK